MANRKSKDNGNMEKMKREMAAKMKKASSKNKSEDTVIDHDLTTENTSQIEISDKENFKKENSKKENTGKKSRKKVKEEKIADILSDNTRVEANKDSKDQDDFTEGVNTADAIQDKPGVETTKVETLKAETLKAETLVVEPLETLTAETLKEETLNVEISIVELAAEETPEESEEELLVEPAKELLTQLSEEVAEPVEESSEDLNRTKVVIFRMGREEFAVEINVVREITHLPDLVQVPEAPYYIAGLCSLRGELLPIIDSKKLFHLDERNSYESNRVIVMEIGEKKVGLLVDKVSEILSVEESEIKSSPANLRGGSNNIKGMLLLSGGKRIVLMIDPIKLNELGDYHEDQALEEGSLTIEKYQTDNYEEEQVVAFYIGGEEYAVEVQYVKEIIRYPNLIRIPYTSDYIDGVTSLRDQLIAIISLDKLMGSQSKEENDSRRVIIIDNGISSFGIVVDKVSNITRVNKSNIRANTMKIFSEKSNYIKGFIDLAKEKRVIILLNSSNLITQKDVELIQEANVQGASLEVAKTNTDIQYEKFVIFRLGEVEFAMQIQYIKEVNHLNELVKFPGAPSFIEGLTNLRDEIIPILNLKSMLFEDNNSSVTSKFLVVEYNKKKIGMLIDSASEVMEISKDELDNGTKDMQGYDRNYIDTVAKLDNGKRIILLLNLAGILSFL